MSGDQLASSFGDPNAQPPTPKQTPTSAVFPSPVFETPKTRQGHFDDSSSWTPRFAEDYSVFNATPGNLRGSEGQFADFSPPTPYPLSSGGLKRPYSAEGLAAEIATHVNHFSPNPNIPLPPVDPSRRLQSSPGPVNTSHEFSEDEDSPSVPVSDSQGRSAKRARRGRGAEDLQGQTATPPPSARKGERKLVPKIRTDNMQNEQGYGHQQDYTGTPQQPNMATFVTTPDMFGYPMSAPATAPANFWDPSSVDMSGMDLDFSAFGTNVFQTPTPSHRPMGSFDATQMFQDHNSLHQQTNQENIQPSRRERPLASKAMLPNVQTTNAGNAGPSATYPTPIDDPFGIVSPGDGVDPGLLFSRSQPPNMDMNFAVSQPGPPAQLPMAMGSQSQPKPPRRGDIRRTASTKEMGSKLPDRASASSPIKSTGRPGLQRSFSENRGKKNLGRASLPALAPAVRPIPQPASGSGVSISRPVNNRPSGRTSPLKNNHSRISSLTSIPEASGPRTRTSVKFTIDSRGRARAETTVVMDEPSPGGVHKRRPSRELASREISWESSDDDSSTDDEPIIIPSRNSSFVLPDPHKPTSSSIFHSSQRSISDRSTSTYATFPGDIPINSQNDVESEAETVMNEQQNNKAGDATSELRKVVESRQKRAPQLNTSQRSQRFASGSFGNYPANTISPTTLTDASLPTPSTDARGGNSIRCVCNRNDANGDGEGFMVQCESCEMWLHGRCINISRRSLPNVYICAFCANTPNMRGGRIRGTGGRAAGVNPSGSGASPLAHKSFKSFR